MAYIALKNFHADKLQFKTGETLTDKDVAEIKNLMPELESNGCVSKEPEQEKSKKGKADKPVTPPATGVDSPDGSSEKKPE